MYKAFYGFQRNPFEISPDPNFYYGTPIHNEALASLVYGVERRKGFVVTTGEVGTGKSLLVRCLLEWLKKRQIPFSHVFHTRLSPLEFLQYLVADLGLSIKHSKAELLIQLNHFLIEQYRRGSTTVLVVDEGQLLDCEVLEEIRLLTNLETVQQKLLQIILVGQPELNLKLDSPGMRQLKQRITFRCNLKSLSNEQTQAYIEHRLKTAGGASHISGLFSEPTLDAIIQHSRGIPRLINTLCENALIEGFAQQVYTITPAMIHQIAADCRLASTPSCELIGDSVDPNSVVDGLLATIESSTPNAATKTAG